MLTIRLRRMGAHKKPFYRLVVSDSRKAPSSRVVDTVGHFDPMRIPKVVEIDLPRVDHWLSKGAQPSATVARLVKGVRTVETTASA